MTDGPEQKMSPDEAVSQVRKNIGALYEIADNLAAIEAGISPEAAPELWAFMHRYVRIVGAIANNAEVDMSSLTLLNPANLITE